MVSFEEKWNVEKLDKLLSIPLFASLFEEVKSRLSQEKRCETDKPPSIKGTFTVLKDIREKISDEGYLRVKYKPSKGHPTGRLYGQGLQSIPGWIRAYVASEYMHDIDLVNAYPSILFMICEKHNLDKNMVKPLRFYVKHRDKCFTAEMENGATKAQAKTMYLVVLHNGSVDKNFPGHVPSKRLVRFGEAVRAIIEELKTIDPYTELWNKIQGSADKKNKNGTFISQVVQIHENDIVTNKLVPYLERNNYRVASLVFDGLMVFKKRGEQKMNPELLFNFTDECDLPDYISIVEKPFIDVTMVDEAIKKYKKLAQKLLSMSDKKHAEIVVEEMKGKVQVCGIELKTVYIYDEKTGVWSRSRPTLARNMIPSILENLAEQVSKFDPEIRISIKQITSAAHAKNVWTLAQSDPKIYKIDFEDDINRKSSLFPLSNGKCVELKTGELRDIKQEDLFTKTSRATDLGTKPEIIERFVADIIPDEQSRQMLQTTLGFCLTNELPDRKLFVWLGDGGNGKSIIIRMLSMITPFRAAINKDLIVSKKRIHSRDPHSHKSAIVPLVYNRVAIVSETEESDDLQTDIVKDLTGGDPVDYRPPWGDEEKNFVCRCKIIINTNHRFVYSNNSAIIDRIHYLNFPNRFVENPVEEHERKRLSAEKVDAFFEKNLNNILAWMVIGAKRYFDEGLVIPDAVKKFTMEEQRNADPLLQCIEDCFVKDPEGSIEVNNFKSILCAFDRSIYKLNNRTLMERIRKSLGKDSIKRSHGTYKIVGYSQIEEPPGEL